MGGRNQPFDVVNVQLMLNEVLPDQGGPFPKLVVDGLCGPMTMERIQKFQVRQFGWGGADGRVDPDGRTHEKLNEFDDKARPRAPEPLTTKNRLVCPHGGPVVVTASGRSVVLRANDLFVVTGCPFSLGPCVTVRWVKAGPSGYLDEQSVGLCFNAAQVPQGPVVIVA